MAERREQTDLDALSLSSHHSFKIDEDILDDALEATDKVYLKDKKLTKGKDDNKANVLEKDDDVTVGTDGVQAITFVSEKVKSPIIGTSATSVVETRTVAFETVETYTIETDAVETDGAIVTGARPENTSKDEGLKTAPSMSTRKRHKKLGHWERVEMNVSQEVNESTHGDVAQEVVKSDYKSSGMEWEDRVVSMVRKLNEGLHKSSSEYKRRKKRMMAERRAFIKQKKEELRAKTEPKVIEHKGTDSKAIEAKVDNSKAIDSKVVDTKTTTMTSCGTDTRTMVCSGTSTNDLGTCADKVIIPRYKTPLPAPKVSSDSSSESSSESEQEKSCNLDFELSLDEMNRIKHHAMEDLMLKSLRAFVDAEKESSIAQPAQEVSTFSKCRDRLDLDEEEESDDESLEEVTVYDVEDFLTADSGKVVVVDESDKELLDILRTLPNAVKRGLDGDLSRQLKPSDCNTMLEDSLVAYGSKQLVSVGVENKIAQRAENDNDLLDLNVFDVRASLRAMEEEGKTSQKQTMENFGNHDAESDLNVSEDQNITLEDMSDRTDEAKRMQERFQYHATSLNYGDLDEDEERKIDEDLDRTTAMFESYIRSHEKAQEKTLKHFSSMLNETKDNVAAPSSLFGLGATSRQTTEQESPEEPVVLRRKKCLQSAKERCKRNSGILNIVDPESSSTQSSDEENDTKSKQADIKEYKPLIELLEK